MSTESPPSDDAQVLSQITTLIEKKINEILIHPRSDNFSPRLDAHRRKWEKVKSPWDSLSTNEGEEEREKIQFAKTIDHTLLKPDATGEMIDGVCDEARRFEFKSVCVNGIWAKRVTENLKGTGIKTCVVVGFPLGASGEGVKAFETTTALSSGASEIDLVISIGDLKSNNLLPIYKDISSVVSAASSFSKSPPSPPPTIKVILETPLLTSTQIISACVTSALAGADYVKTCTGFNTGNLGATTQVVSLMFRAVEGISLLSLSSPGTRSSSGNSDNDNDKKVVKVKASGGIRDFAKCLEMLRAGASRIGTSSGVVIMDGSGGSGCSVGGH